MAFKLYIMICAFGVFDVFSFSVLRFLMFNYGQHLMHWYRYETGKSRFELLFSLSLQHEIYLSHSIQTLNSQCLHGLHSSLELERYIITILAKSTAPITYLCRLPFILKDYSHLTKSNTKMISLTVWLLMISI